MRTIYFAKDLENLVLKVILAERDLIELAADLRKIKETKASGSYMQACLLDRELREKYPMIDTMLNISRIMPAGRGRSADNLTENVPYIEMLDQDYWGILCDVAIKKGIKASIEECIDHIGE